MRKEKFKLLDYIKLECGEDIYNQYVNADSEEHDKIFVYLENSIVNSLKQEEGLDEETIVRNREMLDLLCKNTGIFIPDNNGTALTYAIFDVSEEYLGENQTVLKFDIDNNPILVTTFED